MITLRKLLSLAAKDRRGSSDLVTPSDKRIRSKIQCEQDGVAPFQEDQSDLWWKVDTRISERWGLCGCPGNDSGGNNGAEIICWEASRSAPSVRYRWTLITRQPRKSMLLIHQHQRSVYLLADFFLFPLFLASCIISYVCCLFMLNFGMPSSPYKLVWQNPSNNSGGIRERYPSCYIYKGIHLNWVLFFVSFASLFHGIGLWINIEGDCALVGILMIRLVGGSQLGIGQRVQRGGKRNPVSHVNVDSPPKDDWDVFPGPASLSNYVHPTMMSTFNHAYQVKLLVLQK